MTSPTSAGRYPRAGPGALACRRGRLRLALISGLLFGAALTIWSLEEDGSWAVRIVLGVLAGVMFGVIMGVLIRRKLGAARDELASLPVDQRHAVLRAAVHGPAPADSVVRWAALRQAQRSRDLLRRRSRFNLTVFVAALIGYALLAIAESSWWWFAFALFAAFLVGQLVMPRRVERRIAVLSTPPMPNPGAAGPTSTGPQA